MEKAGTYKIREPNLIGQIGEVIATYILEQLYPKPYYRIVKSHTYPYYNFPCLYCSFHFVRKRLRENTLREFDFDLGQPFLLIPDYARFEIVGTDADFEIDGKERILVDVKTNLGKTFRISGAKNRRYLKEQLRRYKLFPQITRIMILQISLADFPKIRYRLEEINNSSH
jgi:hypothetical protein